MYFPATRGKGLAKKTGLNGNGAGARNGFQNAAIWNVTLNKTLRLRDLGFEHIDYALGCAGHVDCIRIRMQL